MNIWDFKVAFLGERMPAQKRGLHLAREHSSEHVTCRWNVGGLKEDPLFRGRALSPPWIKASIPTQAWQQFNSFYHPSCQKDSPLPSNLRVHICSQANVFKCYSWGQVSPIILFLCSILRFSLLFGVLSCPSPSFPVCLCFFKLCTLESIHLGTLYTSVNQYLSVVL